MKTTIRSHSRKILSVGALLLGFVSTAVHAEIRTLDTSTAENWVLQNNVGGSIVIWNTGASCTIGNQSVFMMNPSVAESNRLYVTIVTAKISGAKIFILYNTDNCIIESFGYR